MKSPIGLGLGQALFVSLVFSLSLACKGDPEGGQDLQTETAPEPEMTAADYAQLGRAKLYVDWEYDEAREALLKAVELNPGDALSHANLSWYWMLEDNKEASYREMKLARAADPDNAFWVTWHGWMCYFYDDFEEAEVHLKESIRMQPEQRDAYFVLGRMKYRNGETAEALKWLEKAGRDSTGRPARAMHHFVGGRLDAARATVDSMAAQPEQFERLFLVAINNLLGDRQTALDWLDNNYESRQPLLPWLRYMPIMRPMHGDPRFDAMVEKMGRPSGKVMTAEDYAQLGIAKMYQEWAYDEARDAFLKAVELNPEDAGTYAQLAWYWMLEDNKAKAYQDIERARSLDPENPVFIRWHGWICHNFGDNDCAEEKLMESLRMQPDHFVAHFLMGQVKYQTGDIPAALDWLEKAGRDSLGRRARAMHQLLSGKTESARVIADSMAANPAPPERTFLVYMYDQLGDRATALDWLDRSYESHFFDMPWIRYFPLLEPLHGDPRFKAVVEKVGKPKGSGAP